MQFQQRRRLLKGLAAAPLALSFATPTFAAPALATASDPRILKFLHTHTGEKLDIVYFENGRYVPEALTDINRLLRDFRTGEVADIDPRLFDLLHTVCRACGTGTFEIISAYRSPKTNSMLRQTGGGGVAKRSLHMEGKAIDIRLSGRETKRLRDAAIALGRGGVGYYPESNFVHLDTGRPRVWGSLA